MIKLMFRNMIGHFVSTEIEGMPEEHFLKSQSGFINKKYETTKKFFLWPLLFNTSYRSSRSQMFFKIVVLKKFRKFYRKTLVLESLLTFFIKKRLQHRCFPVKFAKF